MIAIPSLYTRPIKASTAVVVATAFATAFNIALGADPDHFNGFRYPGRPPWQFGLKSPHNAGDFPDSMPTRFSVPDISLDEEPGGVFDELEEEYRRNYRPPRFEIPEVPLPLVLLPAPCSSRASGGSSPPPAPR
jgi:hypothetical protein